LAEPNLAAITSTVVWGGGLVGLAFGYFASRSNFCTMGAVSDIVTMGDWSRMRMWMLAMAVAIAGAYGLEAAGLVNLGKSIYTSANLIWLSHIVGGFLFGFGMVLGSGCGSKTLMRVGSGNLKSLVVLVFLAIGAYMALRGFFSPFRAGVLDPVRITLAGPQDLPAVIARGTGLARGTAALLAVLVVAGGLAAFALKSAEFRTRENLLGALAIGATIVLGWYVTGHLGYLEEHPNTLEEAFVGTNSGRMESLSFVGPQAYLLELLLLWSDKSRVVTFGIATALGVALGALVYALTTRRFRLEGFREPEDLLNHIVAGLLMGFGGVTALGCTIGQGLSGLSTLAIGSFITVGAIIAGAIAAFRYQLWRIERTALA
jgi:uncharacterized membrane protein YedE/YeeE